MPYLIAIGRDIVLDLQSEYNEIVKMYEEERATIPIQAFFGELIKAPDRRNITIIS